MIYLYKKVDKTQDNTYGFKEVRGVKDLTKPFLLCLADKDNYDKSVFGIMRCGAQAARLYTTQEKAAGFKLNGFPIDILGLCFKKDAKYENNYDEIAERLLYPFLLKEGEHPRKLVKQARKINIITFGNGAITYRNIEVRLKELLLKDRYAKDEVLDILSQISFTALCTDADLDNVRATCTIFNDVNDIKTANRTSDEFRRTLEKKNAKIMYLPIGDYNGIFYSFLGNGKHSIKSYFASDSLAKPAISAIISNSLENSLASNKVDKIIKISRETNLKLLYNYVTEQKTTDELLSILDNKLKYDNAYKYSDEEAYLRKELDDSYKVIRKDTIIREDMSKSNDIKNNKINSIIKAIRKYSSDITLYQILTEAGLWKTDDKNTLLLTESDKTIRKKYDKIPKTVKKEIEKKKNSKKASK